MCKNWREKGNCRYGDRCLFAHGYDELTKSSATQDKSPAASSTSEVKETPSITTPPAVKEEANEDMEDSKFETPLKKAINQFETDHGVSDSTRATQSVDSKQ